MKKFLVSLIIGITCMAIGATMMFFEVKDFTAVSACDLYDEHYYSSVNTFDVSQENVSITIRENYIDYDFNIDESLGDTVKIESTDDIAQSVNDHEYIIEGFKDHDDGVEDSWNDMTRAINVVIDGLKEHKLYSCSGNNAIRITCSSKAKAKININYE